MNVFHQLQDAIAGTLNVPVESVSENTKDEDLPAWDSLGHVNLMMTIEQTFDVSLDVDDFTRLTSVPAILAYLKEHGVE